MTPTELEAERIAILVDAKVLLELSIELRKAGDRDRADRVRESMTRLVNLAACPILHVVLDEVLEHDLRKGGT